MDELERLNMGARLVSAGKDELLLVRVSAEAAALTPTKNRL